MTDTVLAQLAALKGAAAPTLRAKWRALFDTEAPPYNRRFLESRLAYRIQELAYGGLNKETVERLRVLAKQYDGKAGTRPKGRSQRLPIAGTRLIREWQGIEHCVTVRGDDFEYQGQPFKSLSAIAREITGVRWNRLGVLRPEEPPGCRMTKKQPTAGLPQQKLRCAVYTRKSSEEGLEMEFNSLEAQRESCEAYVASQRAEGWVLVPDRYDDGGFSGGTLERPALKRLLADIETGKVDVVVVYKIDRLSRSLMDFSRLVEVFDRHQVTFVSVTQSFNTTTSMGRLTLNVLLSFAQFEREVIGERIRDKFAASRKRGIWMGGWAPLGYEVRDRKLVINEVDADLVRSIFRRFLKTRSATTLARGLIAENVRNKYGKLIDKGILYKMLNNPVYIGIAVHKSVSYPGEHVGIIDRKIWDKVQARFQQSPRKRAASTRAQTPSLLKGIIFDAGGVAMSPTHTRKNGRLYRYYLSQTVLKQGSGDCSVARVPAAEIEKIVIDQVRILLLSPEIIVQTWRSARKSIKGLSESEVRNAVQAFDPLWNQLFPNEQARIVELLVERVDVRPDSVDIKLRIAGVTSLISELASNATTEREAA